MCVIEYKFTYHYVLKEFWHLSLQNIRDDGVIENIAAIDAWKQQDVDARTYIYSTIKNEQQANLQGCTTSHQMWTRIQTEYAELAAENGHLLMAKFFDYKFQPGKRSLFSLPFLKDNMISPMYNRSNHDVIHLIGSTNGSPTYRLTTTDIWTTNHIKSSYVSPNQLLTLRISLG